MLDGKLAIRCSMLPKPAKAKCFVRNAVLARMLNYRRRSMLLMYQSINQFTMALMANNIALVSLKMVIKSPTSQPFGLFRLAAPKLAATPRHLNMMMRSWSSTWAFYSQAMIIRASTISCQILPISRSVKTISRLHYLRMATLIILAHFIT